MISRKFAVPVLVALLLGCAGMPEFDTSAVDQSLTPQSVNAEPDVSRGKVALWGGTILETRNQKSTTQIEMLAYPLDGDYRPMLESKPLGRFIVEHDGYLEPTEYAQGRQLTVLGSVSGSQDGTVGEASYRFPVITDSQLHLWSQNQSSRSSVHFGLGVGIGL
jgi:outer membrane lipoprotein